MYKNSLLVVDDTVINIDAIIELIGNKYDIVVAIDGATALEILQHEKIDLILLDIMMPDMDGYDVCRRLKENPKTKDIPVIFITAKHDEESIEKAYNVGGVDYILKPFKPLELIARIKTHLKMRTLVKNLEYIASHDEMTGAYNRRYFFELASRAFTENKENLYVVIIDIDKFKDINDTYGHGFGDKAIQKVVKKILSKLNKKDIFGRIGGDEFAMVICSQNRQELIEKIEAIRREIESLELEIEHGAKVTCTISEGIAKAMKEDKNLDEVLKRADKALYEAKGEGKNRIIFR